MQDLKELRDVPIKELSEDDFIKAYSRLVHHTVWSSFRNIIPKINSNTGLDIDDLAQLGMIGLVKARKRFDASLGLKFSTYAVPLIWGEIQRAMREGNKIKVTRTILDVRHKILREGILSETPDHIAKVLDIPLSLAKEALAYNPSYDSLNRPLNTSDSYTLELGDVILDKSESFTYGVERNEIVDDFLSTLKDNERHIWYLYNKRELGQAEVAQEVGLSQAQISRTLRKINLKAEAYGKRKGLHSEV